MLIIAGYTAHVMTFEVGAILEDPKWQAPVYCFKEEEEEEQEKVAVLESAASGSSFRKLSSRVINNASNL